MAIAFILATVFLLTVGALVAEAVDACRASRRIRAAQDDLFAARMRRIMAKYEAGRAAR